MTTKRILVADDEPDITRLVKFTLERQGHEVTIVNNGEAALEKALEVHPDLILLDVTMPVLDGYEACRKLKGAEETKNIPVLMLSAKSQQAEIETGLEAGADDYVQKPFNPKELVAKVNKVLGRES